MPLKFAIKTHINPNCIYCALTPMPSPQAVSVTTTPSAVVLTRVCTRPVGGGVEACVRVVCTTPQGQSVTSVPQATSQIPTAKWTVLMPAYVSGSFVKLKVWPFAHHSTESAAHRKSDSGIQDKAKFKLEFQENAK